MTRLVLWLSFSLIRSNSKDIYTADCERVFSHLSSSGNPFAREGSTWIVLYVGWVPARTTTNARPKAKGGTIIVYLFAHLLYHRYNAVIDNFASHTMPRSTMLRPRSDYTGNRSDGTTLFYHTALYLCYF